MRALRRTRCLQNTLALVAEAMIIRHLHDQARERGAGAQALRQLRRILIAQVVITQVQARERGVYALLALQQ